MITTIFLQPFFLPKAILHSYIALLLVVQGILQRHLTAMDFRGQSREQPWSEYTIEDVPWNERERLSS